MAAILVTGGAGYIGSHTVLDLITNGYDVVIFDNLEGGCIKTINSLKNIGDQLGKSIDFVKGDLKNINDISGVFKRYKIDAVLHFAAYICVQESVNDPRKYYENNVVGSLNLFAAMIDNHVSRIVFSSTAAVYGEPVNAAPINEKYELLPINPYGRSKLTVERILKDYDDAYGLKSVALRYFNVVGADSLARIGECHEPETHLVPNILKAAASGEIFSLFGDDFDTRDRTCVRDYVNVEDLADAHILALRYLENENQSDCFNIGTNVGSTVKEVLEVCERVSQCKINLKICARRMGEPAFLVSSNKKAEKILGWKPKKSLEDSIRSAYEWHRFLEKI